MSGSRFRPIDFWHYSYFNSDSATIKAADEIINKPDKFLLTQKQIFENEGSYRGLVCQAGGVFLGLAALYFVSPRLFCYLKNA